MNWTGPGVDCPFDIRRRGRGRTIKGGQGGVVRLPTFRRRLLRSLTEGLAFLGAVDTAEADAFRALVVQDFDGIAVEDGDDEAGEVGNGSARAEQEQERAKSKDIYSYPPHEGRRHKESAFPMETEPSVGG